MTAKYFIHAFLKAAFPVSQFYGANPAYYAQYNLQHGHEGVDFATPNGTELFSPFDGIVVRDTMNDKDYGNFVVVWDPVQKCALWFCHLLDVVVQPSEQVKAGQLIGHTNNTGNTTGPHVHVNFVETDENGYRTNLDNGEQGFLNLLDATLVEVQPFPGLSASDPQTPLPSTPDEPETPALPAAPVQPTQPVVDPQVEALTKQVEALTQQNVDLTTKVKETSDKYTTDLANYQVMVAAGFSTVDDIDKKLEGVETNNIGLQKQILQVNKSNAALAEQLKAKNEEDSTAIEMGMAAQSKVKELTQAIETIAGAHGTKPTVPAILTAVDKLKSLYEDVVQNLQHKTIRQDVAAANMIIDSVPKSGLSAWDYVASLILPNEKGVATQ